MAIKIKGKEYPIQPTMWALLQFKRDKGKGLSAVKDDELEDILYYTWLCVRGACMQQNTAFEMSFEDYIIYVEGDPAEELMTIKLEDVKKKKARL